MDDIAVIIPTYKTGHYFYECVSALNSQTLSRDRFRVYIALNGPRQPYEEFVYDTLKNCNFKYKYIYLDRASVSGARNYLLDISEEKYVTFIDDDDVVSRNYLECLLAIGSDEYLGISNVEEIKNEQGSRKK